MLTDDQGYSDVGVFGAQGFTTPNLDRLAAEGVRLTNFYVGAPICSPSRAALMTGSYPVRVGMTDVLQPGSSVGLNPREVTIADLLKSVGYATAAVGKWHLGDRQIFLPTRQGFDEYFGLPYSNDMTPLPLLENEDVIEYSPDLSQLTKRYTERALDFITRNQQNRFFLYFAHTMPHVPIAASDDFKGKSARGLYGDVIMEIDWSVGQILAKLDELGIANKTLVVFASDNGPWLLYGEPRRLRRGPFARASSRPSRGDSAYPGSCAGPTGSRATRVSNEVVTAMDLLPTIAAITGAALPTCTIDGRNVLPILEGSPGGASPPTTMYFYAGRRAAGGARRTVEAAPAPQLRDRDRAGDGRRPRSGSVARHPDVALRPRRRSRRDDGPVGAAPGRGQRVDGRRRRLRRRPQEEPAPPG